MEIFLAILLATAVIFFGALISIGNERQRKAIDSLREQAVLWAVQDLKIKRENLVRNAKVDEPLVWLNKVASKVVGDELKLQVIELIAEPTPLLVCHSQTENTTIFFCTTSPADMRKLRRLKHNRLTLKKSRSLLLGNAGRSTVYEISILNGGILFDVELPLAWSSLTGTKTDLPERLWMYEVGQEF